MLLIFEFPAPASPLLLFALFKSIAIDKANSLITSVARAQDVSDDQYFVSQVIEKEAKLLSENQVHRHLGENNKIRIFQKQPQARTNAIIIIILFYLRRSRKVYESSFFP